MTTLHDQPGRTPRLLLASRSPRRRALLTEAGYAHEACHPGFEDGPLRPGKVTAGQWVASLAKLKAWAGARTPEAGALLETSDLVVLGADTACVMDGVLIGTPATADEAAAMVRAFANREHEVVTGVALMRVARGRAQDGARVLFADRALVRMGELSEAELAAYVASGAWAGKAGGYNIAERIAAGWDISFEGDVASIMGLPMRRLGGVLSRMGIGAEAGVGGGA
jgi:septum formation protein